MIVFIVSSRVVVSSSIVTALLPVDGVAVVGLMAICNVAPSLPLTFPLIDATKFPPANSFNALTCPCKAANSSLVAKPLITPERTSHPAATVPSASPQTTLSPALIVVPYLSVLAVAPIDLIFHTSPTLFPSVGKSA